MVSVDHTNLFKCIVKVYCWLDYYYVRLIIVYDFEIDIRLNTEFAPPSPSPLVTLPLVSVGGEGR